MKRLTTKRFVTSLRQANRYRKAGERLFCNVPGQERTPVQDIGYRMGAAYEKGNFEVQVNGSDEWITPLVLWAEPECINLWDLFDQI